MIMILISSVNFANISNKNYDIKETKNIVLVNNVLVGGIFDGMGVYLSNALNKFRNSAKKVLSSAGNKIVNTGTRFYNAITNNNDDENKEDENTIISNDNTNNENITNAYTNSNDPTETSVDSEKEENEKEENEKDDEDEKEEGTLTIATGIGGNNKAIYFMKKEVKKDKNNKTVFKDGDSENKIGSASNKSLKHKDYALAGKYEPEDWGTEKDIKKSLNKELPKSIKERNAKIQDVMPYYDPKQFDYDATATFERNYSKLINYNKKVLKSRTITVWEDEEYVDGDGVTRTRRVSRDETEYYYETKPSRNVIDKYGKYVGESKYVGASETVLISEKLENYFNKVESKHLKTAQKIEDETRKSFNLFRYANGKENFGENKDSLDKKGRNARELYKRDDKLTDELFKNYSHDKDDFHDVANDDKRYDDFLNSIRKLKALVVDEENSYNDLVEAARQQLYFRNMLQYHGLLNAPKSEEKDNIYANTFEDGKTKTIENSLNYLISFRIKEIEKLNRNLNNADKRVNLVLAALDNVEKLALKDINKLEPPQLKRIYQSINFIVNQSQQVFNVIAQNQLGHARYNQMQRIILANQNSKLQKEIDELVDNKLKTKQVQGQIQGDLNYYKGEFKNYKTSKYSKNSN